MGINKLIIFIVISLSFCSVCFADSFYTDEFSGSSLDAKWTATEAYPDASYTVSGGYLRMIAEAAGEWTSQIDYIDDYEHTSPVPVTVLNYPLIDLVNHISFDTPSNLTRGIIQ